MVYKEIKTSGEWGSFFTYSQYQRLKRANSPSTVIEMAKKNGYHDLDNSMTPEELVTSLLRQGSYIAERKEVWIQGMMMTFFDPVMTTLWVLMEKFLRSSTERRKNET